MTARDTNVLVVEDDPQTLDLERLILEGGGYRVSSAARGEEAIEMVADSTPDLVLLDIGLPGIDGFTTCKVIRKFSQVPIIMVTGSDAGNEKVRGLDLGADDYITKPFSQEELFARSKAVLRRSNLGGSTARRFSQICERAWRSARSVDYGEKSRLVWQHIGQLSGGLAGLVSKRPVPITEGEGSVTSGRAVSRWRQIDYDSWLSRFLRALRSIVLILCKHLRNCSLALARLLGAVVKNAAESPLTEGVRASRAALGLAYVASKLCQSDPAQRAGWCCRSRWESTVALVTRMVSRIPGSYGSLAQRPAASPTPGMAADTSQPAVEDIHAPQLAFLEELLRAYLKVAEIRYSDPMISAPVLPLVDLHQQMLASSGRGEDYTREHFAREVFLLHSSGVDYTPTGARVQFPISRGVPKKTLITTDDAGCEVKYYGVRFMQSEGVMEKESRPLRCFDESEMVTYSQDIKEALSRQLNWPSESFARFLSTQLNFGDLSQKECRLLAQAARDAWQELMQESAGEEVKPPVSD